MRPLSQESVAAVTTFSRAGPSLGSTLWSAAWGLGASPRSTVLRENRVTRGDVFEYYRDVGPTLVPTCATVGSR